MWTRRRARFFAKCTSSEERVGLQFVFSAFVMGFFCFLFVFVFVLSFCFCLFSSLFSYFSYSICLFLFLFVVFPLLPSFPLAHKHGISPDSLHTQSCTFLFLSSPLKSPSFQMIDLGRETDGNNEICLGVRFCLVHN